MSWSRRPRSVWQQPGSAIPGPGPAPLLGGLRFPEAGHDTGARPYFEGWYFKCVTADQGTRLAVIPGLFRGLDGRAESFVQVLDGMTRRSWYVRYPAERYRTARRRLGIAVGPNRFTAQGLRLDLPEGPDGPRIRGRLRVLGALDPWPVRWRSPGAMGWYSYVPFMECYHHVTSFGHGLAGTLRVDGAPVSFDGGRGYIEQDWGQAFPSAYLWVQCNHFDRPDVSLMASVAVIPWLRGQFTGVLIGLRTNSGLHRFTTYTGAAVESLRIHDERIELAVRDRHGRRLALTADRPDGALLHAPVRHAMHRRVEESLTGRVTVRWDAGRDRGVATGTAAGIEVHGEVSALLELSTGEPLAPRTFP